MYPLLTKQQLTDLMSTTSPNSFQHNISKMHHIYKLPINNFATLEVGEDPLKRLDGFFKTIRDEVDEYQVDVKGGLSIREKLVALQLKASQATDATSPADMASLEVLRQCVLTDIADWFSDLVVYIRSEAMKFGIPLEDTLDAVMASNFSKIKGGANGTPVYDENGKVQKDLSCFIPPEPAIRTVLFGLKSVPRHPYENIQGD